MQNEFQTMMNSGTNVIKKMQGTEEGLEVGECRRVMKVRRERRCRDLLYMEKSAVEKIINGLYCTVRSLEGSVNGITDTQ